MSREQTMHFLSETGEHFKADTFDWRSVRSHNMFYRCCQKMDNMTCGKVLLHARDQVTALREEIGLKICIFKVGVTSNPLVRFNAYLEMNYSCMWVISELKSLDKTHMLEAALISQFQSHVGCRNKPNTGGEGGLNRTKQVQPPFFVYVVGGRADLPKWVG